MASRDYANRVVYSAEAAIAAAGTRTIHTPAADKALRIFFLHIVVSAATIITVRSGANGWLQVRLGAAGQHTVPIPFGGVRPGATGEALIIHSSAAVNAGISAALSEE